MAEGARLEIVYPANNGIVGSTPTLSAIFCIAKNGGEVSPSKVSFGEADSPSNSVIQNLADTEYVLRLYFIE